MAKALRRSLVSGESTYFDSPPNIKQIVKYVNPASKVESAITENQ